MPDTIKETEFTLISDMIREAQDRAWRQVNSTLIKLYWDIGQFISNKSSMAGWGKGMVEELSGFILSQNSGTQGFSARNIWRMKQFYEAYKDHEKLSALLTEITWTNHLHILSKTKSDEEREFYLQLASNYRYSERELARIIDGCTFERTMIANKELSTVLTEFPGDAKNIFKSSYIFDFLSLPEDHMEVDLQKALIQNLKKFLLELGPDFTLIGEEYPLQVGMKDFRIDILMHHRGLNCLCAIELKTTDFKPDYMGQIQFYLEALDRNVKKEHENPSIGILICKTKNEEIVEYALSRSMSPTMIAEYKTKLIDKELLQRRLHAITKAMESGTT
ncbi:MAG: DUF1016 family protein [Alphaproteobacteria bacterium]|nr:DUF1016 family protein [Alphaproteobacteria bacterium]